MKREYDFSRAVRGKFCREGAELRLETKLSHGSTPNTGEVENLRGVVFLNTPTAE